ncbi:hypothetical protein RDI58_012893 [Solanum bulbocastanum]|uniref:NB-ARC domain-containing protein n=1 Tax=Solanum bulbocastanum TaxID=147425 RepID=A0AAN8TLT5_SOLBU
MCFKDTPSESSIILTTRLSNVANYAKYESELHHLRLFRDDESWTLLQQELFQGKSCPPEIVDVGFRIAKKCGGLPLFIVLVLVFSTNKSRSVEGNRRKFRFAEYW